MSEGEGPRPGTLYIYQIHAVVHYYINQYISGFDLIVISCSIHAVSPSLPSLSSLHPPTKEAPKGSISSSNVDYGGTVPMAVPLAEL